MLLPDTSAKGARLVADRIRSGFAEATARVAGLPVNASVGIGMSMIEDPREDIAELLAHADLALYGAKAGGRNRVVGPEPELSPAA